MRLVNLFRYLANRISQTNHLKQFQAILLGKILFIFHNHLDCLINLGGAFRFWIYRAVVFLDGETKVFKTEGEPATLEEFSFTHGVALGHVRYATVQLSGDGIQPIRGEHNGQEFFVAHNGEISNFNHLLGVHGFYDLPSDSALIAKLISSKNHLDFEDALLESLKELEGAYSLVIQIGETLYVSRDRAGMRPCVLAKTEDGLFVASESHVFDDILNTPYELEQRL